MITMGLDCSALIQYHLSGLWLPIILTRVCHANSAASSTLSLPTNVPRSEIITGTLNKDGNQSTEISKIPRQVRFNTTARNRLNRSTTNNTWARQSSCPDKPTGDCSQRFVDNYSSFYLKIGGWLMLGVVLAGVTALAVTHFLGRRHMRRPRRRELSRILWAETLTKNKLARFV